MISAKVCVLVRNQPSSASRLGKVEPEDIQIHLSTAADEFYKKQSLLKTFAGESPLIYQ